MKKQLTGFLLSVMLLSMCVGCSAESTTTEPTETAEAITTEESTSEQAEEAMEASEETKEQAPKAIEEPSEEVETETEKAEVTPETTTEPEATKEPEETAESEQVETPASPATEPASPYTYTDMSATMYAQQTVNVRDLPDTKGNKLGGLSTNDEITITGQCNETGWYRFEYNGGVAYVSDKYVGENKVEVQQDTSGNGEKSNTGRQRVPISNFEKYVWHDMGDYFFIITNSKDEYWYYANNTDGVRDIHRETLRTRYPGREAICAGVSLGDPNTFVISAVRCDYNGEGRIEKIHWEDINYIELY